MRSALDPVHDFSAHPQSWFDYKYRDKLGKRFETFRRVFQELAKETPSTRTCVETGCVRELDDYGAGYSTYLIGEFLSWYGGVLHTVDITPKHMSLCRKITKKFRGAIDYHVQDSVQFLTAFPSHTKIDFLYLDSYDFPGAPSEGAFSDSQVHCRKELLAAIPHLRPGSLVLIDDSRLPAGGKARLAIEEMRERHWECLMDEYQTLWRAS